MEVTKGKDIFGFLQGITVSIDEENLVHKVLYRWGQFSG